MNRRDFFKLTAAGAACTTVAMLSAREKAYAAPSDKNFFNPKSIKDGNFINLEGYEAILAGYPVSWWDKHYGLPLHIHYAPQIKSNVKAFRNVFDELYPKGEIRFAAKANPHPEVFKMVVQENEGIDVASPNEAEGALIAGADPRHLDVNGNTKTDDFIRMAMSKDMVIISDSLEEFVLISELAKKDGRKPRVLQRLSGFSMTNVTAAGSFTCGVWTKFGMNIKDINQFFAKLDKYPHIDFQGFHVHIGSPIATLDPYKTVAAKLVEFSKALQERGRKCKMINLGGGYPINYVNEAQWDQMLGRIKQGYEAYNNGDKSKLWVWENGPGGFQDELTGKIDLENWTGERFYSKFPKDKMMAEVLKSTLSVDGKSIPFLKALKELGEPTVVIEPGRSVAEDSGVTISKVGHLKKVDGIHDLIALEAGVVNFADAMEHEVPMNRWALATGLKRKDMHPFNAFLAGQLCFTGDMPSKYKVELARKPERGDVLLTRDTGAYDPHFYAANTNAFPRPARVLVLEDGSIEFIKTRDTLKEIYSL
jgi:diaminopimelate decarboxylase